MMCENCKGKEATVHYQEIVNGVNSEVHLCEECAGKKGMISFGFEKPNSFGNLLSGFLDEEEVQTETVKNGKTQKIKCKCGWTGVEFKKTGYLGCQYCYKTFKKSLTPLLRRIHGNNNHIGKIPVKTPVEERVTEKAAKTAAAGLDKDARKLKKLKDQLHECVKEERYEEAAKVRDEIRSLEQSVYDNEDTI
jgi:protein arginine kinase activator